MESLSTDDIAARLARHGLELTDTQARLMADFLGQLEHWNRVHNLTGIRDRTELIDRHLVESLALEPMIAGSRVADIGSGAGLPGLPLAIRLPATRFTLIESRRKRVSFLRHVTAKLALINVEVVHGRAESLGLAPFPTILARAVAPPAELLDIARPMLEPDGRLVVLTGADKRQEFAASAAGFRIVAVQTQVEALQSRILVLQRELS